MARVRLFAGAREAAGTSQAELDGATVGEVLDAARNSWGRDFSEVLTTCAIWVNGERADHSAAVGPDDEVAILPPVSGG